MDEPRDDARSWPRRAARLSILAALLCCSINCVFGMLTRQQPPDQTQVANLVVGSLSMAIVVAGLLLGGYALAVSLKRGSRDTLVMALLGLALNGGIVFVTLWGLYLVGAARQ